MVIPAAKVERPMPRPLICVTLSGCTVDEMLKDAAMATAAGADMVEVRFDKLWVVEQMPEPESEGEGDERSRRPKFVEPDFIPQPLDSVDVQGALESLKQGIDLPVVFACRPERQQGHYPGEEKQRLDILRTALESGVSWIDLEVDIESSSRTSDDGDIVKVCYKTSGRGDGLRLFEAAWGLRGTGSSYAIMGSGWGGDWTRIHAPLLEQTLVYTTTDKGMHLSRQGRINASDLQTAWQLLEYETN